MHVQRLQLTELQQVILNSVQVVVRQVEPDKVLRVIHHVFKHARQLKDRPDLVVLQEESLRALLHHNLFLGFSFGFLNLAPAKRVLLAGERDAVVHQNGVDLLGLRRTNHLFFGLGRFGLFLSMFLVGRAYSVLVLFGVFFVVG